MTYVSHLLVLISLYAMLAQSLNLVLGYAGVVSLAHGAFFGIGAYTAALLTIAGWSLLPAALVGMGLASLLSFGLSLPALRLRGDYVVLCTLGVQIVASGVFENWTGLTRGPAGIGGIPAPSVLGIHLSTTARYAVFAIAVSAAALFVLWFVMSLPFGRSLKALRDDDIAAQAIGKDTTRLRLHAFVISAAMAALPGALFAGYARYVDPTSFTLGQSIFVLSCVIVGGAGRFLGPVLGAAGLLALPEVLNLAGVSSAAAAYVQQIAYGLSIVVLMRWRPQGLVGQYKYV